MWQFYDNDEYPDNFKDLFKVAGLCLLGWVVIFLLMYLGCVIVTWFK